MSKDETNTLKTAEELRSELKAWEAAFLEANGRKAGREDIKRDAAISASSSRRVDGKRADQMCIAAKYRDYNTLRKAPTNTHTTPRKKPNFTPRKVGQNVLRQRSVNAIAATPSRVNKTEKTIQPPVLPAVPEEEPTPAHVRCALGPTPQKDGAVLGIFDMLSGGTPSKGDARLPETIPEALISGTPSKSSAAPPPDLTLSRTPQSSSTRRYLDALAGTPLKRKRADDEQTQTTSSRKLFATPSFLRRNWPLARIDEDTSERPATAGPPFKKRPLVRSLSTIIQGLKKQEEERMEDEWDIMNEIEAEERGGGDKPAVPSKVLVEDSQAPEMPLGPDRGVESSEDEGATDRGALDANGNPRKVWKKKGLKRQTRRVIMRPVLHKATSAPGVLDSRPEDDDDEVVGETQLPETSRASAKARGGDEGAFVDDAEESDAESKHDSQQSRHEKDGKRKKDAKVAGEPKDGEKKKTRNGKPDAHANYRKLKIKNKNSKANGRGRFGRR